MFVCSNTTYVRNAIYSPIFCYHWTMSTSMDSLSLGVGFKTISIWTKPEIFISSQYTFSYFLFWISVCMYMYESTDVQHSFYPSFCLSVCLFDRLSLCLLKHLSIFLSVSLVFFECLSIFLSVRLFVQMSVSLLVCLYPALPEGRAKWPAKPAYLLVLTYIL